MTASRNAPILVAALLWGGQALAYEQDYLTYWETEAGPAGKTWYNYVVANTGRADYSSTTTVISVGPPRIEETHVHNEIPIITRYAIPVLSAPAWSTVDQKSIYQPNGWAWQLVDATPANWTNTTGNPLFDHPYKVLEWYVVDKAAPDWWDYNWQYDHGLGPAYTRDEVNYWASLSPDDDPVRFWHWDFVDGDGNTAWESGGSIWSEVTAPAFGFLAYSGKTLSPDQTGWDLAIQDYRYTTIWTPLPPRIGDPDVPLKGSGVGALALPTAPVPEPETYAMFLTGLGLLGAVARRRRTA